MLAWLFPNWLMFRPPGASYTEDLGVIRLPISTGALIAARFYENPAAEYTVLFSHGNAEDIGLIDPFARSIRNSGFSVLTYDYQGYGMSDGSASEANTYRDIDAAYRYLTVEKAIPPERIIVHGRSIGGGPSIDLASRVEVGGLIIESTFLSAARVLSQPRIIPFDAFDNIAKVQRIRCPVLVIHGRQDRTIPFSHGEQLYDALNVPKSNLWVESAGHNDVFAAAKTRYLDALRSFAGGLQHAKAR